MRNSSRFYYAVTVSDYAFMFKNVTFMFEEGRIYARVSVPATNM
jgi:hypothetical protein